METLEARGAELIERIENSSCSDAPLGTNMYIRDAPNFKSLAILVFAVR